MNVKEQYGRQGNEYTAATADHLCKSKYANRMFIVRRVRTLVVVDDGDGFWYSKVVLL